MSTTGLLFSSDTSANEESALEVPEEQKEGSLPPIDDNSLHDIKGPSPISFASQDEDERIRSGDFSNVVGPDSLLSQELQDMSQRTAVIENYSYDHQGSVNASSLLSQDLAHMSSQDSTASNGPAGTMSSSQLSCLVRAAKELESPLPSPAKGATNAAASHKAATSNKQIFDSSCMTCFDTTYKPPSKDSLYSPPRKVQSLGPRRAKQSATRNNKHSKPPRRASKTRAEKEQEQTSARQLAKQAADLAAQAIASPEISKQLLLSMVFSRTNPRSPPASWPPKGSVIEEGFFWGQYPPLETKLKSYMRAYYDLSVKKCQSKEQQAFNNDMVVMIRAEALQYGWSFSPNFSEKSLRDRVRCYFKTHVQNSKKRLRTMLMNPTKKANTKALIGHLDMIKAYADRNTKDYGVENKEEVQLMAEQSVQVNDYDAVQRMMSLGFARLSQDSQAATVN